MPAQAYEAPAWGSSPYEDMDLPSGAHILVKRLAFEDIIAAGLMDEFDTLTPVAEENVVAPAKGRPMDRQKKKPTKAQAAKAKQEAGRSFMKDQGTAQALIKVLALMLPQLVIQPSIVPHLEEVDGSWKVIPPERRTEGLIYVDTIPMTDQMHIFDWAMSGMDTDKLQQFREQSDADLGAVEPVEEAAGATQPTSGG